MEPLAELRRTLLEYGTGPLLSEMPRRTLADKGIASIAVDFSGCGDSSEDF